MTCVRPANRPAQWLARTARALLSPPYVPTLVAAFALWAAIPHAARAEPVLVGLEADGAMALGDPQQDLFAPGASVSLSVMYPLLPQVLVGARLRGLALLNGNSPSDPGRVDPGFGSLEAFFLAARLRPFAASQGARATGLFLDGGFGAGLTGEINRATLEAGLGFGIDAGSLVMAPAVRYLQIVQPSDPLSDADARIVMVGLELIFGDDNKPNVQAPPPPPVPSDRDRDGLADIEDTCPDEPEDHDGHEDQDGCPDPDNDADGILDTEDDCPDEAEDLDEFADEDGCPDPDNDQDSFLDAEDECPNEAEIVNGNKDYDGCPDEGLIEFKDDRIVLEERVLFDLERARVKRAARPILRAIVKLQSQHPEWISIRIEGHADARGDEAYNQDLSRRRAENVREVLVRLGIASDLIQSVGYGSSRPRDKRDDPDAYQRNRRVEFVVVARKGPKADTAGKKAEPSEGAGKADTAEGADAVQEGGDVSTDAEAGSAATDEEGDEPDPESDPAPDVEPEVEPDVGPGDSDGEGADERAASDEEEEAP